jgi:hypothetical protein
VAAASPCNAKGPDIEGAEIAVQFDRTTCRWTALGDAAGVHRSSERARIVAALRAAGGALAIKEIMIRAAITNRNATDLLLLRMVEGGDVVRVGRGQYDLRALPDLSGSGGR